MKRSKENVVSEVSKRVENDFRLKETAVSKRPFSTLEVHVGEKELLRMEIPRKKIGPQLSYRRVTAKVAVVFHDGN